MGIIEKTCLNYANWIDDIESKSVKLIAAIPMLIGVCIISLYIAFALVVSIIPSLFGRGNEVFQGMMDGVDAVLSI